MISATTDSSSMRLLRSDDEIEKVRALLPAKIRHSNLRWDEVIDKSGFNLRSDLLYFDVIHFPMLSRLPGLLVSLEEEKCFIFHYERLFKPDLPREAAFEITSRCSAKDILFELSNEGPNHDAFLSVFYLTARHGVISCNGEWCIFAEPDERCVFLSSHEAKYSLFLKEWWSVSCELNGCGNPKVGGSTA
jgi:hypothetical protein